MNSGPFGFEAEAYWKRGYSVVPIEDNSKRPAKEIKGWQGYHTPPAVAKQREWLARYASSGIGLLLGTQLHNGYLIGAIDVDDDAYIRVAEAVIGANACAKRGKKGITGFVAYERHEELKSTQLRDSEQQGKVDILLGGKMTILPPTLHPDTGQPYEWTKVPLLGVEVESLPILTVAKLLTLRLVVSSSLSRSLINGSQTHDAGLGLTAKLVAQGCSDIQITSIIEALLPVDYAGDSLKELPGWIESARKKGFDKAQRKPIDDFVADVIEKEFAPLIYSSGDGFLRYAEGYWQSVPDAEIDRRAKATLSSLIDSKRQVQPMLRSVRECLALNVERPAFGMRAGRICVRNGTVNVHTGELEPHSPDHELRFRLDIEYDAEALCPVYETQLTETLLGDETAIELFDEFCALTLVPDMRFQKALYLIGEAGSGKSTLLKVLEAMHDPAAISVTPLAKIVDERYLTDLARKLACISFDVQTTKKVFSENFIRITGGDPVTTRRLYHEVEGRVVPTVRFIGSMNPDMPGFIAAPDALSRRLIFIRCGKKVASPDRERADKLLAERPGILARWVRALRRLEERGEFLIPQGSTDEVEDYISTRDGFDMYAQERLISDNRARTTIAAVTRDYNEWAREMGEAELQAHVVGRKLRRLGYEGGFATVSDGGHPRSQRVVNARLRTHSRGDL